MPPKDYFLFLARPVHRGLLCATHLKVTKFQNVVLVILKRKREKKRPISTAIRVIFFNHNNKPFLRI